MTQATNPLPKELVKAKRQGLAQENVSSCEASSASMGHTGVPHKCDI